MPLTADALGIMATILLASRSAACEPCSIEEAIGDARQIQEVLFRPPSPAAVGKPPPPDGTPVCDGEGPAETCGERLVKLTAAEVEIIQRGLTTLFTDLAEKASAQPDHPPAEWQSAWDKLYPLGAFS